MIKKGKLICSLSLAFVASVAFSCASSSSHGGLQDKTHATVTFNANNGTWLDNKTSIRTISILKGHTWGYLVNNGIGEEGLTEGYIYSGKGIDLVSDTAEKPHTFNSWKLGDTTIDPSYIINKDITVTADIDKLDISFALYAQKDHGMTKHYFGDVGSETASVTISTYQEGQMWTDDIQNANLPNNVEGNTETFLYYTNEVTGQKIENGYLLKDGDILVANYLQDKPNDFGSDSWEIFGAAANLGFQYMSTNNHDNFGYLQDYEATEFTFREQSYTKDANTFVGLKRDVLIGGTHHTVRVVGENVDNITQAKNATLTFEFEDIVSANRCFDVVSHNSNNYESSSLYDYLNTKFYYTLPPEVRNIIVPVRKYTNIGAHASSADIRTTQETIFPLSLRELNYKTINGKETPYEGVQSGNRECYALYSKGSADDQAALRVRHIIKPDGTQGSAATYWLRSPDVDSSAFAWAIDDTGHIPAVPVDVNDAHGVVCGFCVGGAPSNYNVTFNVSMNGGEWDYRDGGGSADVTYLGDDTKTFRDALIYLYGIGAHQYNPVKTNAYFSGWCNSQGVEYSNDYSLENGSFTAYAKFDDTPTNTITLNDNRFTLSKTQFSSGSAFDVQLRPAVYRDDVEQYTIHTYPEKSSILVEGNGRNYQESEYYYDQQSGTLSFRANSAPTLTDLTITIKNAPIVCDWERIGIIATEDERLQQTESAQPGSYAQKFFYVGDTTTLNIQDVEHKIQIIDFGHVGDTFASESGDTLTAAINFDFLTVASSKTTSGVASITSNFANRNVVKSNMQYLNNNLYIEVNRFFESTPGTFRNLVKNVQKETLQGDDNSNQVVNDVTFNAHFYPLSMAETNCSFASASSSLDKDVYTGHDEGTAYALYQGCAIVTSKEQTIINQKPLIKYDASGNSFVNYYLRTGTVWRRGNPPTWSWWYRYYTSCIMNKHSNGYMKWNTGQTEEDYMSSSQHITKSAFAPGFAI